MMENERKENDSAKEVKADVGKSASVELEKTLKLQQAALTKKESELVGMQKKLEDDRKSMEKEKENLRNFDKQAQEIEAKRKQTYAEETKKLEKEKENLRNLEKQMQDIEAKRRQTYADDLKKLENEKEILRKREKQVQDAEIKRENGYTDERKKMDEEIFSKRKKLEEELTSLRSKEIKELSDRLSAEEKKHRDLLEKERIDLINEKEKFQQEKADVEKQKFEAQALKTAMEQKLLGIEEETKRRTGERESSFVSDKKRLEAENERLRSELRMTKDLWDNYDDLKQKLGGEPEEIWNNLKAYEERMNLLKKELHERPPKEMQETIDILYKKIDELYAACNSYTEENQRLRKDVDIFEGKDFDMTQLEDKIRNLTSRNEILVAETVRLDEENKRMRSIYERAQDRDKRKEDIEKPYFEEIRERSKSSITETEWLDGIMNKCSEYGLKFPKRILYAYHTALKTAEWSPLTVLSGVSGTGKSELPRLYAHFGGLNFLGVSVQPNWDSQESMLGFFNSIDNRFDAQSVLRLLAQTQNDLDDVMTLILLDEMNLAHIELYFAEFLSKLESRRGKPEDDAEFIEVKLGSGLKPYELKLGRNVLWTGTINQDETTKSLSDKVLDRGIIISFPRPTVLERRKKLKPLGKEPFQAAPLLPKDVWRSWRKLETIFTDDEIKPYKGFVENMNNHLSKVSRALGHRVWQSVEYYMVNYPGVSEAKKENDTLALNKLMHTAFEDQLVQKIMPKLRGIETRGNARSDCLDKIRSLLEKENYSIVEDFDLACKFGYGQFIWNSANYIKEEEETEGSASPEKTDVENHGEQG